MKRIFSLLGSMHTMAVLMSIFAFVVGYATFVENDYGTLTAKADIYNARWFETLLALLALNLIYNMFKYKMFSIKKAPIFIFHLSFLVILLGAAMTRFEGFEGTMSIREGAVSNTMLSSATYFKVNATSGDSKTSSEEKVYMSKKSSNTLTSSLKVAGKDVKVELVEYIPDAIEKLVEGKSGGSPIAELMITENGGSQQIKLERGTYYENGSLALDFESGRLLLRPTISVFMKDGKLYMNNEMPLDWMKMDGGTKGQTLPSDNNEFATRTLYGVKGSSFVLRKFYEHANTTIITNPEAKANRPGYDAFKFKMTVDGKSKETMIFGAAGELAQPSHNDLNGVHLDISYGSKILELPFSIKLIDFQLDRYPGSMSPASYASEVELIDKEQGIDMPYRIFMNNILEHRGYRFFQSSYDRDERGTILSVNNDPGTLPSYIGYFLLGLGMFWSLLSRGNRFDKLSQKAKKASNAKVVGLLLSIGLLFSVTPSHAEGINPTIKQILAIDKDHASKFGELVVQDSAGRMKPLDTFTTEIVAKIYRGSYVKVGKEKLTPNQVVLGMMLRPGAYREFKIIRTKNEKINALIGARADAKYASFSQFFEDPNSLQGYKLANAVDTATRKEPKHRDLLDKAVLKVDEKVNISYAIYSGTLMKIWPKPNDPAHKWFPTMEAFQTFAPQDSQEIQNAMLGYFQVLDQATRSGNFSKANKALEKVAQYQQKYGYSVIPSKDRIKAEIFYNKSNVFETIYPYYLLLGFILLILSFTKILKPKFNLAIFSKISLALLAGLFLAHTFGLGLRWFISGHAPWSNGYESMMYISWATVLAGFIFSKRSTMTMASTAILTGLILFVAHLNWMDPQITNLVPVLNSYWLSIHVAIITASYGFLGLGALLGFVTLLLFILKNSNNEKHISLSIKELNAINEMSLMIGLAFLTLGNFLGGVWANESWGRYWGWDPKETWALVTILVYAVVVHLRFIKSIYSEFNYSVISLLSFSSVIMTYFGVNYYLAGMHSYAKGDPVPIPDFVPITYAILFVIIVLAFRNRKLA